MIRFTAPRTANAYVWPASHKAATGGASDPPMGAWFRLKAGFDISGFSPENQVVLRALKKHGMVLADNGSPWFLSGAPDPGWNDSDLGRLRTIAGSAFEAVDVSSLKVASTSYAVAGPAPTTTTRPSTTTSTTAATTTTTTVPPAANLVANPGFESSLAGWTSGNSGTALARTCSEAHSGSCSAAVSRKTSAGNAVLDDSPNTVSSSVAVATYSASAWVRVPAGRSASVRIREFRSTTLVQARRTTATGTGGWQQLSTGSVTASGGTSVSVDVYVSLPAGARAQVDDVTLKRG